MDRTALGTTLAERLQELRGKDAVIVCLQESSLLTCLTMAANLRAWVYPLIYVPAYTPDSGHQLLGAFDQEGEFCPLPGGPADAEKIPSDIAAVIDGQQPDAAETIRQQMVAYGITFDEHRLDGRDVILVGDVITNVLPMVLAQRLLARAQPRSLTAVAGNTTPEVAQLLRVSAAQTEILDILNGITFDDDHYFEHTDGYTPEQKHTVTQHIAAYWQ